LLPAGLAARPQQGFFVDSWSIHLTPSPEALKKAVAFVDGQNLYFAAFEAFGYHFPNYDPASLAKTICLAKGWELVEVRFYTGMPDRSEDSFWHHFWSAKKTAMIRQGIHVFTRPIRYRDKRFNLETMRFNLPDGSYLPPGSRIYDWDGREIPPNSEIAIRVGEEKGIDIRIALDIIRLAREDKFEAALIFSQDQDLSEVVDEVTTLAESRAKKILLASAFPEGTTNQRGINKTEWIIIKKATYDACIDLRDYRPKKK
jgi:uncharacterized LabA/DUF88 family protein